MKQLTCELCQSTEFVKEGGVFVCRNCQMKYSVDDVKKMMDDSSSEDRGGVNSDGLSLVNKNLSNARRAYDMEDWEDVEKYYNLVEQNVTYHIEATFFSVYGKAMLSLSNKDINAREQKFNVLKNTAGVISRYFDKTDENKQEVLARIVDAVKRMVNAKYVYDLTDLAGYGNVKWHTVLFNTVIDAYINELSRINEPYIQTLIDDLTKLKKPVKNGGCYVATCVYGSYDCPQVWTLRRYRDDTLGSTWYGRLFIRTYYAVSPTLVKWFGHTSWFKKMWKGKLDRMVANLNKNGVEDTPYEDKKW